MSDNSTLLKLFQMVDKRPGHERRSLTKAERDQVFNKYGGHCAYCGCTLTQMHVDHLVPVARGGQCVLANFMPSCPQCNNFKHSFSLEQFRRELQDQVERARKYSVNFRIAERFGMIEVKPQTPIVFYFERCL